MIDEKFAANVEGSENDNVAVSSCFAFGTLVIKQEMYTHRWRLVDHRIVSVSQPHICPIVRGKLVAQVEIGAKLAISLENSYSRVEKLSFAAFNKSTIL